MISTPNVYRYTLDDDQRGTLEALARDGKAPARKARYARALLLGDHGRPGGKLPDARIAEATGMHINTVARVRKAFAAGGPRPALERKARETPPVPAKVDGDVEAHLIAICTGPPPEGRARWTMELIAGEVVRRGVLPSLSGEAVRLALKKTS